MSDANRIVALIRDSIRIHAKRVDESELPQGASKLGGSPDLPSRIGWPEWKTGPLSFLAQVRMDEVAPLDGEKQLPPSGILYFFYDQKQSIWGFDPKDRGGWRVLYNPESAGNLARAPPPPSLPEESRFSPCALEFSAEATIPPWESNYFESFDVVDDEYFDLLEKVAPEGQPVHRIMGYPDQIQGDMQTEVQLVSNGLYCGDSRGYDDPRAAELRKGASDWQLLLQLDSDDAGFMWGDAGRVYFWIRRQDLHNRVFDNVWLVLQCG